MSGPNAVTLTSSKSRQTILFRRTANAQTFTTDLLMAIGRFIERVTESW